MNRRERRNARRQATSLPRRPGYMSPEGRKHPAEYNAIELRRFLVEDAVRRHPTDLAWATVAYLRIGKLERCGAEVAFTSVREEVMALGLRGMPTEDAPY